VIAGENGLPKVSLVRYRLVDLEADIVERVHACLQAEEYLDLPPRDEIDRLVKLLLNN
jgi:hypothetical protein